MTIFVFLGPSLPIETARTLLPDAHYLPPAVMGDVHAVVTTGMASAIALIDGGFDHSPAVWHKEILHALDAGVPVYGASSMGALRAAELEAFGMRGVGEIFEHYRDGRLEDDDEVAVMHGPAAVGYACTSLAMASVRHGLSTACQAGLVSPSSALAIEIGMKALYYPERTWAHLEGLAARNGLGAHAIRTLRAWMSARDLKAADARRLLEQLRDDRPSPMETVSPRLERSALWLAFLRQRRLRSMASSAGRVERQAGHLRVRDGAGSEPLRNAALWVLLEREGRRRPLASDKAARGRRLARKRRDEHLLSPEATRSWLEERGLSALDLERWGALDELLARLQVTAREDFIEALEFELRRRPPDIAWPASLPSPDAGALTAALEWYEQNVRTLGDPLERHAADLGFDDVTAFLHAVADHYGARISSPSIQLQDLVESLEQGSDARSARERADADP